MFRVNNLSAMNIEALLQLSRDVLAWQFFDVAPYDGVCCGLYCSDGPTAFLFSELHRWGDVVLFACSAACIVGRIDFEVNRYNARVAALSPTIIPVGEYGSFKVVKQGSFL